jgi:hypothetical protein
MSDHIDPNVRTSQKQHTQPFLVCLRNEQTHVCIKEWLKQKKKNMHILIHLKGSNSKGTKKGLQDVLDDGMHWHRIKFHRIVDRIYRPSRLLRGFSASLWGNLRLNFSRVQWYDMK